MPYCLDAPAHHPPIATDALSVAWLFYAMQLEDEEEAYMDVVEVDDALAILTCKRYNYKYAVVTPNDIVIPPRLDDNLPED